MIAKEFRGRAERLVGLDVFRIISALFIFLFHSHIHIQCQYGIFNEFINMSAVFMTAFYLLSGYVMFYTYNKINLEKVENIKTYYLKRAIDIMPLYYLVAVSFVLFLGSETIEQNILLAPIEMLGLQSVFTSIFSLSHNGGTWFISCLLICYLIYPFVQEIIKQIKIKTKCGIIAGCIFVLLWSPLVQIYFSTSSIYANPFFGLLEFIVGSLLCSLKDELEYRKNIRFLNSWIAFMMEFILLVVGVTIASKRGLPKDYMLYSWIALPIFIFMLISLSGINNTRNSENRIIRYLSSISYAFFFAQFYVWKITNYILDKLKTDRNVIKIVVSFATCMLIAILLYEIVEKPLARVLKKKLLKTDERCSIASTE